MGSKNTDCTLNPLNLPARSFPVYSEKRGDPLISENIEFMAQTAKSYGKRGKPSYFMSILGVTLVLFLLGIIGWLVINANKLGNYFKENVEVGAYLRGDLNPKDSADLMEYISSKPYVRTIEFITKEAAKKK